MNDLNSDKTDTGGKPADQSEGDFLEERALEAQAAIGNAIADAKAALAEGMDPKVWARRYPLVAIGSALAAGFAAAICTIPSKEERELRRAEKLGRALHPEAPHPQPAPPPEPNFWSMLATEAIHMIRPVLTGALTAALAEWRVNHQKNDSERDEPSVP